uniref:Cilia- and flagella-associated protein 44-like n=1 Tax=Diabrotica virgifera virgifera TaxID=50390 RepID=A0A6P7HDL2_DIAVI
VGHIKFWKMAHTFTGLKLQGELGRFGKTEYSDILGVLPMPDEKVVSGCDWGNILIWDGGLITLEVLRTLRKNCHEAPIVQIFYEDEELWTVSLDGHVRIWWYEKIDRADPPDDDRVILLDPSYDFYTPGMSLYQVTKRREEGSMFIAQDGNGGIWQIDLNTVTEPEPSMQLYKCHAGKVVDIATYCNGRYLASLGRDGRLYIYNYLTKKLVFSYEFPAKGSRMLWPEAEVVSGCDWGNILIWDGGLITLEVLRTLRKNCHEAPIVQIFYEDEELWTVSLDGHVRIWWYEKIDRADPPDDDR